LDDVSNFFVDVHLLVCATGKFLSAIADDEVRFSIIMDSIHLNFWFDLPREVGDIVVEYIEDIDTLGYLNMICHMWPIIPNQFAYATSCRRIYGQQSVKKIVNVQNWGNWRNMLILRPRLRTNGFYSLRTSYFKPPVNDAFWEEKLHEFHEVVF
jgi:hypothetical protein